MSTLLSVLILTYNEEVNLPVCLESLRELDCKVFVVDSGSSDRTVEIAKAVTPHVVYHEFENQAQQLNWALTHLPIESNWILRLDADERLTPKLAEELRDVLPTLDPEITGLYVNIRVYFMGRWIRHGAHYPLRILRVWRRDSARIEERAMNERTVLVRGRAVNLKQDIIHDNQKSLFDWVEKHNKYSTRELQVLFKDVSEPEISPSLFGPVEARRRWLRHHVYLRVPLFLRAFLYFGWRYFFRLGFLDGKEGLIFHFLHAGWYRFLIDAKIYEARKSIGKGKTV